MVEYRAFGEQHLRVEMPFDGLHPSGLIAPECRVVECTGMFYPQYLAEKRNWRWMWRKRTNWYYFRSQGEGKLRMAFQQEAEWFIQTNLEAFQQFVEIFQKGQCVVWKTTVERVDSLDHQVDG
jgi:hypothetical protein